ncbi:MAG: bifunctional diguanylate cyclase/phosphodiesterase [Actinobacteria bacterium]|nr:bifunctional diguanylate cyclase/phosphodiesterase [Actinomycetota bacterium]
MPPPRPPAPPPYADGPAGRDLAVLVAASVVLAALAMRFSVVSYGLDWLQRRRAAANLDGLLALVVLVPLAATIYSRRRYRDARDAHEQLREQARRSPLTGLPNRSVLDEAINRAARRSHRLASRAAVLYLDVDRFKLVNDTYGHRVGDQLMAALALRLHETVGDDQVLVHLGEDEFVLVCPDVLNLRAAERIGRRLASVAAEPFTIGSDRVRITMSAGATLTSSPDQDPNTAMWQADLAMYHAKSTGSGEVAVFDPSVHGRLLAPRTSEARLREALERGEFTLAYQPVVDLRTGRIVGAESLLRWRHPERGEVGPDEFVPVLEETGLIVAVGRWVLEEAAAQAGRWYRKYGPRAPLRVAANVSARQLAQVDFQDLVDAVVVKSGLGPGSLCLELTEGALMSDIGTAWTVLRHAKNLGVAIALDDFGTGYSSLSYVRRFNLDVLKIDRSFVSGLGTTPEDTAIVAHVIGMAKALGMTVVAEGVEEVMQVRELQRLGCDHVQGWLFGKALPVHEFEQLFERPHPWMAIINGSPPVPMPGEAETYALAVGGSDEVLVVPGTADRPPRLDLRGAGRDHGRPPSPPSSPE